MMPGTNLFKPNNHSQWRVHWNKVDSSTRDEVIRVVRDGFGFELQGDVFQSGAWEVRSHNYRLGIFTESGRVQEVVLKKDLAIHRVERMRLLNQVIKQLAEFSVPVPKIIHSQAGQDLVEWEGYVWEMFEYIPGEYFRGTEQELEEIARRIAQLHIALNQMASAGEVMKSDKGLASWDVKVITEHWEYVRVHLPALFAEYEQERDVILICLQRAESKKQELRMARRGIVRNSLHPHDTLFVDEKCLAIIDFEEVGMSELMREVASACHRFVRQFVVFQEKPWKQALATGLHLFLQEYFSRNPVLRSEIDLLPFFLYDELLRKLQYALCQLPKQEKQAVFEAEVHKFILLLKESVEIEKTLAGAIAHF
jgi:Ser/Thr protein kinase RdoA (MazF antagonist)